MFVIALVVFYVCLGVYCGFGFNSVVLFNSLLI